MRSAILPDLSHRAVLTEPEHGDLSVVIAGDKEEFVRIVGGEVGASHAVDRSEVDLLEIPALDDLVSFNAEISNRVKVLAVMGDRDIGGV